MRAPGKITEKQFMQQVLQLARMCGWLVFHNHDARRSPEGFPDLVMTRGTACVVAELKVGANQTTAAQRKWLAAWAAVPGVAAYTWRPDDWDEIKGALGARS